MEHNEITPKAILESGNFEDQTCCGIPLDPLGQCRMKNRPFENLARDLVKLHPETVARAAQHAEKHKPKRKRKRRPTSVPVWRIGPTECVTVDPRVMATALELAGGDHRRLQILPDGAVLVMNHPRTTKPQPNR